MPSLSVHNEFRSRQADQRPVAWGYADAEITPPHAEKDLLPRNKNCRSRLQLAVPLKRLLVGENLTLQSHSSFTRGHPNLQGTRFPAPRPPLSKKKSTSLKLLTWYVPTHTAMERVDPRLDLLRWHPAPHLPEPPEHRLGRIRRRRHGLSRRAVLVCIYHGLEDRRHGCVGGTV